MEVMGHVMKMGSASVNLALNSKAEYAWRRAARPASTVEAVCVIQIRAKRLVFALVNSQAQLVQPATAR